MTLEGREAQGRALAELADAVGRWAWLASERGDPLWEGGDAEELGVLLAVAAAFPKMLEALENIRQIEEYVKGRPCLCGEPGCVQCLAISALRAAREAVRP